MIKLKIGRKGIDTTISPELLQRIDFMDDKERDNPYEAVKREYLTTDELFNDSDYDEPDDSGRQFLKEEKKTDIGNILAIGLIVILLLGTAIGLWILATKVIPNL